MEISLALFWTVCIGGTLAFEPLREYDTDTWVPGVDETFFPGVGPRIVTPKIFSGPPSAPPGLPLNLHDTAGQMVIITLLGVLEDDLYRRCSFMSSVQPKMPR